MGLLTVHRVCRTQSGPAPTRQALCELLDQLTRTLADLGHKPVRILKSESWKCRPQDGEGWLLVRLRIECEPGEPTRPLGSWYQWQHPCWQWSLAAIPAVDCESVYRGHIEPLSLVKPVPALPHEARP